LVKDTDGDDDRPGSRFDPDTDIALTFGHPADVRDTQAVAVLIGGYYKAAAAGDGRKACSMMFWLYAETTVEEHSKGKGARSLRGSTCAQIAGKVFRGRHRELVEDAGSVNVSVLRVQGKQGLARVRFGATRERLIPLKLDRGAWRMNTLLDAGAP
jgi:hypothetical protein